MGPVKTLLAIAMAVAVAVAVAACVDVDRLLREPSTPPCDPLEVLELTDPDQIDRLGLSAGPQAARPLLVQQAGEGDAEAAFCLYHLSDTPEEQRLWVCRAAHLGLPAAQSAIAKLYWPRPGAHESPFPRDMVKALVWAELAIRSGQPLQRMVRMLTAAMTPAQLAEASTMAARWRPDPESCGNI